MELKKVGFNLCPDCGSSNTGFVSGEDSFSVYCECLDCGFSAEGSHHWKVALENWNEATFEGNIGERRT